MPCKKDKSPVMGLLSKPDAVDQRLAMYIVTSKPKRISVYSGLLHMVFSRSLNCKISGMFPEAAESPALVRCQTGNGYIAR